MGYRFDTEQHLHTLDGRALTGCSSIVGVISKPLGYWYSGMALKLLGWTPTKDKKSDRLFAASNALTVLQGIKPPFYLELLDKAYRHHKDNLKETAQAGIDLHAELEKYVKDCISCGHPVGYGNYPEQIHPFIKWANENVKRFLFSEAHCYSRELWTGGITDFGCELMDGTFAIGDFKSSKAAYTSQIIQGAGYGLMIEENGVLDKDGNVIFKEKVVYDKVIIVPFGANPVVPVIRQSSDYKQGFRSATHLYKLVNMKEVA